jgi:type II secretory pathway component PulJ
MANSLGTASNIIQMTQLTDELRNAMSMMSRDLRRANYSAHAAYCYANSDCGSDGSATQAADLAIDPDTRDCLVFNLDRNQDGDAATDNAGGVRYRLTADGIGYLEIWVGDAAVDCDALPDRADEADWVAVTDPGFVDVTTFLVDDSESFSSTLVEEGGAVLTQRSRQVRLALEGRLIRDGRINRRIEDVIKVRNDIFL